jgi:hypothetical protein
MPSQTFWYSSRGVLLSSYVIFGIGVLGIADYYRMIFSYGYPRDLGIITAACAIALIGLLGITIAKCLKNLEDRIDRLQQQAR